jgi:hypothetical protein|nr:MAG TPA: hypothetical protein [Crassvirales sp.]
MEKTIKDIKERAENLKKNILQAINDFEIANPEVNVNVTICRNYSADDTQSHKADIILTIK